MLLPVYIDLAWVFVIAGWAALIAYGIGSSIGHKAAWTAGFKSGHSRGYQKGYIDAMPKGSVAHQKVH